METHEVLTQETPIIPPSDPRRGDPVGRPGRGTASPLQEETPALHRARGAWKERKQRLLAEKRERDLAARDHATRDGVNGLDLAVAGVFAEESAHLYEDFFKDLRKDLRPCGRMEELCVEQMAIGHWRLKRALRAERGYIVFYAQTNEYRRSEHMRMGATKSPVQGDPGFADACRVPNPAHADHVERFRKNAQRDLMRASEMLERLQARRRRLARARVARLREKRERARKEKMKAERVGAGLSRPEKGEGTSPLQKSVLTALHETPQKHPLTPSNRKTNGNRNGEKNFQTEMSRNGGGNGHGKEAAPVVPAPTLSGLDPRASAPLPYFL